MLDLEGREGGGGEEEVEREAREIKGFTPLTEVHPHPYTPPPSHTHTHTHTRLHGTSSNLRGDIGEVSNCVYGLRSGEVAHKRPVTSSILTQPVQ